MPGTERRPAEPHLIVALALATAAAALSILYHGWPVLLLALVALGLVISRSARLRGLALLAALALLLVAWQQHNFEQQRLHEVAKLGDVRLRVLSLKVQAHAGDWVLRVRDLDHAREYRLRAYGLPLEPAVGDCLRAEVRLRPAAGSINFHGFDYGRWLYREGVHATGTLSSAEHCENEPGGAADWRGGLSRALLAGLPEHAGRALLAALLLADRSGFDAAIWETLARTGTSHLFAISGLHVGLVSLMLFGLGGWLWRLGPATLHRVARPRFAALAAMLGVALYTGLASAQVSALRAGCMALLVLGLLLAGRRIAPLALWAVVLILVIAVAPFSLLGPALYLSFTAVLLILLRWPALRDASRWRQLVELQLWMSLGLGPLALYFFGQWSLVGILLNLLLVPALAVFLPLLLLAAALKLLGWGGALALCAAALQQLIQGLHGLAAQPHLSLSIAPPPLWLCLLAMAGVLLLGRAGAGRLSRATGLLVVLLSLALILRGPASPPPGTARLWLVDVGQGQATLIQTHRHWVVVDSGPAHPRSGFDAGQMIVAPQLRALGARALALLVTSHADLDHAGGQAALQAAFPVARRWGSGAEDCEQGLHWQADGVTLRSLPTGARPNWSRNDRSCVVLLEVAGRRVLLPGDIEARGESALLPALQALGGVHVVLVPHHGSSSSSSTSFVEATRPELALVSAGRLNRWGFPREEVVQRWRSAGATLLVTGRRGAIAVELPQMTVRRPAHRPWHPDPL